MNLNFLYYSLYMFSKQQLISTKTKSANDKYPINHRLCPLNAYRFESLGKIVYFQVFYNKEVPFGEKAMAESLSMHQVMTPAKLRMIAFSLILFPKSSVLLDLSIMQLIMAEAYVTLKSPSIRQGRLGKSRCNPCLSFANHCSGAVYCTSYQVAPVQASSNLGIWPLPLILQYPRVTLLLFMTQDIYALNQNKLIK